PALGHQLRCEEDLPGAEGEGEQRAGLGQGQDRPLADRRRRDLSILSRTMFGWEGGKGAVRRSLLSFHAPAKPSGIALVDFSSSIANIEVTSLRSMREISFL